MLRYQLLAIDIDGTLVNSRDELTPATRAALARAGEAGIHVVLATGRRYSHTLHLVEPLAIDVPLVTASGALVKDPADHRTLYWAEFDRAVLCQALAIIDRCGYDVLLCADTYTEGFDFYQAAADAQRAGAGRVPERNRRLRPALADMLARSAAGRLRRFRHGQPASRCSTWKAACTQACPASSSTHVLRSPRVSRVSSASWPRRA